MSEENEKTWLVPELSGIDSAFKAYIKECDEHATVPNTSGAFVYAWQAALSTSPLLDKNDQAEGEKLEWEDYEKIRDFREVDFAINNFHLNCTADNATEMVKAIVENTRNYPQPPQPDSNELVELRRDAERYRYFRGCFSSPYHCIEIARRLGVEDSHFEPSLDVAIDAAIAQSTSVGLNTKKGG